MFWVRCHYDRSRGVRSASRTQLFGRWPNYRNDRPRLVSGLRIAWSVWWGIVCVLLVGLWREVIGHMEVITRNDSNRTSSETTSTSFMSNHGTLAFMQLQVPNEEIATVPRRGTWSYQTARPQFAAWHIFYWRLTGKEFILQFPTWLPVILVAVAAAVPWYRRASGSTSARSSSALQQKR